MMVMVMVIFAAVCVNSLAFCALRNFPLYKRRMGEWRCGSIIS